MRTMERDECGRWREVGDDDPSAGLFRALAGHDPVANLALATEDALATFEIALRALLNLHSHATDSEPATAMFDNLYEELPASLDPQRYSVASRSDEGDG